MKLIFFILQSKRIVINHEYKDCTDKCKEMFHDDNYPEKYSFISIILITPDKNGNDQPAIA